MRHQIYRIAMLIGLSALAVPVLIYVVGRALVGPYEGPLGLLGLIGNIYSDASLGRISAWFLLLSPVLILLVWYGVARLRRTRRFHGGRGDDWPQHGTPGNRPEAERQAGA